MQRAEDLLLVRGRWKKGNWLGVLITHDPLPITYYQKDYWGLPAGFGINGYGLIDFD